MLVMVMVMAMLLCLPSPCPTAGLGNGGQIRVYILAMSLLCCFLSLLSPPFDTTFIHSSCALVSKQS